MHLAELEKRQLWPYGDIPPDRGDATGTGAPDLQSATGRISLVNKKLLFFFR
jgi:hypothetical protein